MAWIALTALVVWFAIVVVVRSVLRHRWEGTAFLAVDWRRWVARDWVASALGGLAAVALAGSVLLSVTGTQLGPHLRPAWPWIVPALGLVVGANVVMVWSQLTMGASWRIGVDRSETTELVTRGPFHRVRNPIYSTMVAIATGVTVLVPTIGTLVGTLAMVSFIEWQVRAVEEPFLAHIHGRAYAGWTAQTGRFLPGIGRSRQQSTLRRWAAATRPPRVRSGRDRLPPRGRGIRPDRPRVPGVETAPLPSSHRGAHRLRAAPRPGRALDRGPGLR